MHILDFRGKTTGIFNGILYNLLPVHIQDEDYYAQQHLAICQASPGVYYVLLNDIQMNAVIQHRLKWAAACLPAQLLLIKENNANSNN